MLTPTQQDATSRVSDAALLWLLAVSLLVLLPQLTRLPPLLLAVCGAALLGRLWGWHRQQGVLPLWVRLPLFLLGLGAIYGAYAGVAGVEPAVALLLLCLAGKWLELNSRRDGLVLIQLACFAMVTQFLFDQSLLMSGYALIELLVIITAWLVLLHEQKPRLALGWAVRLLGQSLPLMVALFVLFPRIGPLWSIPLSSTTASSGFADELSPGDMTRLRLTSELVLRARFEGVAPSPDELFWRGLVLTHFDGRSWRQANTQSMVTPAATTATGQAYELAMEPTNKRWIFALDHSQALSTDMQPLTDGRLQSSTPINERRRFRLLHEPDTTLLATLSAQQRQSYLQLPPRGNQSSRQLAAEWRAQNPAAEAVVARALDHFHTQPFYYSLEAPPLGDQPVDQFLFETRNGYCEHYASALAFLLRAAGLPTRIVAGYHGAEWNPIDRYLIVRQSDAHAWVEVWSDARMGWMRVDPTAAVAPERVSATALRTTQSNAQAAAMSGSGWRPAVWLHQLQLYYDATEYRWHRSVLGYDLARQQQWFGQWFDAVDGATLARASLLVLLLATLLPLLWLLPGLRARSVDPADRAYHRFCHRLAAAGLPRQQSEPPFDYARRIAQARPDLAAAVNTISQLYIVLRYAQPNQQRAARLGRHLRRAVRRFRV